MESFSRRSCTNLKMAIVNALVIIRARKNDRAFERAPDLINSEQKYAYSRRRRTPVLKAEPWAAKNAKQAILFALERESARETLGSKNQTVEAEPPFINMI